MDWEPVLGDLPHWPMRAEVWGTFAAWAGALLTGLSFAAAATYYFYDKWREDRAQAQHVRIVITDRERLKVTVFNYSDKTIYNIKTIADRIKLEDAIPRVPMIREDGVFRSVEMKDFPVLAEKWDNASTWMKDVPGLETGQVKPNDSLMIDYERPPLFVYRYRIVFRDAMARAWEIEFDPFADPEEESKKVQKHKVDPHLEGRRSNEKDPHSKDRKKQVAAWQAGPSGRPGKGAAR
ncbi:hypothetical protein [Rhodococcus koreensis]|nr:hypothetical protein [Rhodococcus koreensis]